MNLPKTREALAEATTFVAKQMEKPATHEYGEARRVLELLALAPAELHEAERG